MTAIDTIERAATTTPAIKDMANARMRLASDPDALQEQARTWMEQRTGEVLNLLGGVGRNLGKMFITVVTLFFFYRDGERFAALNRNWSARYPACSSRGCAISCASSRSANAMRSSSSRTGAAQASSSRSRSGSSNSMGSGMGSTADSLPGGSNGPSSVGSMGGGGGSSSGGRGGPGGGGGSEFMMVLQDAAKPGVRVPKGAMVAEFDRQYMLTRLDDYRASVSQSEASFKSMQANLATTKQTHNQSIQTAKANLEKAELDLKTTPVRSAMDTERLKLAVGLGDRVAGDRRGIATRRRPGKPSACLRTG